MPTITNLYTLFLLDWSLIMFSKIVTKFLYLLQQFAKSSKIRFRHLQHVTYLRIIGVKNTYRILKKSYYSKKPFTKLIDLGTGSPKTYSFVSIDPETFNEIIVSEVPCLLNLESNSLHINSKNLPTFKYKGLCYRFFLALVQATFFLFSLEEFLLSFFLRFRTGSLSNPLSKVGGSSFFNSLSLKTLFKAVIRLYSIAALFIVASLAYAKPLELLEFATQLLEVVSYALTPQDFTPHLVEYSNISLSDGYHASLSSLQWVLDVEYALSEDILDNFAYYYFTYNTHSLKNQVSLVSKVLRTFFYDFLVVNYAFFILFLCVVKEISSVLFMVLSTIQVELIGYSPFFFRFQLILSYCFEILSVPLYFRIEGPVLMHVGELNSEIYDPEKDSTSEPTELPVAEQKFFLSHIGRNFPGLSSYEDSSLRFVDKQHLEDVLDYAKIKAFNDNPETEANIFFLGDDANYEDRYRWKHSLASSHPDLGDLVDFTPTVWHFKSATHSMISKKSHKGQNSWSLITTNPRTPLDLTPFFLKLSRKLEEDERSALLSPLWESRILTILARDRLLLVAEEQELRKQIKETGTPTPILAPTDIDLTGTKKLYSLPSTDLELMEEKLQFLQNKIKDIDSFELFQKRYRSLRDTMDPFILANTEELFTCHFRSYLAFKQRSFATNKKIILNSLQVPLLPISARRGRSVIAFNSIRLAGSIAPLYASNTGFSSKPRGYILNYIDNMFLEDTLQAKKHLHKTQEHFRYFHTDNLDLTVEAVPRSALAFNSDIFLSNTRGSGTYRDDS